MALVDEVRDAAQSILDAADPSMLPAALNGFIGQFCGPSIGASQGVVVDHDGNQSEAFACVVHVTNQDGRPRHSPFSADDVAAVIDCCRVLDVVTLRAAYARIVQAKRLGKRRIQRKKGVPQTNATLGVICSIQAVVSLDILAEELRTLNEATAGQFRPDMVVVASTGTIQYAVQFPSENLSGDFLPPGNGALDAYTPPMYIVMVLRPALDFALNRMLAFLVAHLTFFVPDAPLPRWTEMISGLSQQAVTVTGYQYNLAGELVPVPRQFYNDRYLPPRPFRVEDGHGTLLATLQFLPWQDGGAVLLKGKPMLEPLLVFLGREALAKGGIINLREGQLSYVLPITEAAFRRMLGRIQRQSNMVVRPEESSWTVKKIADEGSQSPFMARLLIGIFKMRDMAFPRQESRGTFDAAYDGVISPLLAARTAMKDIAHTWNDHANRVESGVAARLVGRNIHVDETIDRELARHADTFINGAARALKHGMQSVGAELGVNIGFLFQKEAGFEAGFEHLSRSDPALALYLAEARRWSEVLVGRRNAIEHEGWRLADIAYARIDAGVRAVEPQVDGRPVTEFAAFFLDRLCCFVEDLTAHSFQRLLPGELTLTELAPDSRSADTPERFRITLARGGQAPWGIAARPARFEDI
jgi:hypothetical protein